MTRDPGDSGDLPLPPSPSLGHPRLAYTSEGSSQVIGINILDTVTLFRYSGLAMKQPMTLQAAIIFYADLDNCLNHLVAQRWPDGVVCPTCGSKDVKFITTRRIWECKTKHAKKQFSIKVGTIFEDSPIGLDKWLTAA